MDVVDVLLVLRENEDGRRRLLEAREEVEHLGLLLDVLDLLDCERGRRSKGGPNPVSQHQSSCRVRTRGAEKDSLTSRLAAPARPTFTVTGDTRVARAKS